MTGGDQAGQRAFADEVPLADDPFGGPVEANGDGIGGAGGMHAGQGELLDGVLGGCQTAKNVGAQAGVPDAPQHTPEEQGGRAAAGVAVLLDGGLGVGAGQQGRRDVVSAGKDDAAGDEGVEDFVAAGGEGVGAVGKVPAGCGRRVGGDQPAAGGVGMDMDTPAVAAD